MFQTVGVKVCRGGMEGSNTDSISLLNYKPIIDGFHKDWFLCTGGREASKSRMFVDDAVDFLGYVESCGASKSPCYVSVQPYKDRNIVFEVEKLFWDFDAEDNLDQAWQDAASLRDSLKQYYEAEALVVFSGSKGYHVYTWLRNPVRVKNFAAAKVFYKTMQHKVTTGLKLPTLDPAVVGDLKRLSRVPYTLHEKSGRLCTPVDANRTPVLVTSLTGYRLHGLSSKFVGLCEAEATLPVKRPSCFPLGIPNSKNLRPCIREALSKQLDGEAGPEKKAGHYMRIAISRECLIAGFQIKEIVDLFKTQSDFDAGKSRYYIEYLAADPYPPFKCKTIEELCFCLGDSCPFYRKVVKA